jgi:hypothetical protein
MEQRVLIEIDRLRHDYADLKAEIKELSNAVNQHQVSNSRKRGVYTSAGTTCEAILKFIYRADSQNQKPANKMMLDELLVKVANELPVQVMINFRTIQAWRNLGTHDKDDMRNIDNNSLIMVDMALSNIVNWFFTSYLNIEITINEINQKRKAKVSTDVRKKRKSPLYDSSKSDLVLLDKVKKSTDAKSEKKREKHNIISTSKKVGTTISKNGRISDNKKSEPRIEDMPFFESIQTNFIKVQNQIEIYPEIKIGNQIWMLNNLNVEKFSNGDDIMQAKTKSEWNRAKENKLPAWCYFENDENNSSKFGKLYNWFAVNDKRGIAPFGWKIPSTSDYEQLLNLNQENEIRAKLNLNFGGKRTLTGNFTGETDHVFFWTECAPFGINYGRASALYVDCEDLSLWESQEFGYGYYVRCIKT